MRPTPLAAAVLFLAARAALASQPFALELRGGASVLSGPESFRVYYLGDNDSLPPLIAPNGPQEQNLVSILLPPAWAHGGDAAFPLGTDSLGRCVLSRLIYSARVAMAVALFASLGAMLLAPAAASAQAGTFFGQGRTLIYQGDAGVDQISGVDMGSFSLASVIGNATEQLFDVDPNVQEAAGLSVPVKSITLNARDDGIGDKLVPLLAQQQGVSDPAAYRTQMAGMAEGAALQMLGSTDAARALGEAVGNLISGKAKALTINVVAKDANGIAVPVLMQASEDPTALTSAVDITGSNPQ